MKTTKNTKNTTRPASDADLQYCLRTECQSDCLQVRAVLGPWLTSWREDRCQIEDTNGTLFAIPDQDVFLSMQAQGPSLAEIRWLLGCLVDCHVAAESVNTAAAYDGERLCYIKLDKLKRRPSDEVVKRARDCVARTKVYLRQEFSRLDEAKEQFNAELKGVEAVRERRVAKALSFWTEALAEAVTREDKEYAMNALELVAASADADKKRRESIPWHFTTRVGT